MFQPVLRYVSCICCELFPEVSINYAVRPSFYSLQYGTSPRIWGPVNLKQLCLAKKTTFECQPNSFPLK